jgi:hypothetical protein
LRWRRTLVAGEKERNQTTTVTVSVLLEMSQFAAAQVSQVNPLIDDVYSHGSSYCARL